MHVVSIKAKNNKYNQIGQYAGRCQLFMVSVWRLHFNTANSEKLQCPVSKHVELDQYGARGCGTNQKLPFSAPQSK